MSSFLSDGPTWTTRQPTKVYGYIGGKTNITCEVDANPKAKFEWFRHGRQIFGDRNNTQILEEGNKSVYRLTFVNSSVIGDYRCKAVNEYGPFERVFRLEEGPKPGLPKKTKVHSATHNSFQLDIIPPDTKKFNIIGYGVQILEKNEKERGKGWEVAKEVNLRIGKH